MILYYMQRFLLFFLFLDSAYPQEDLLTKNAIRHVMLQFHARFTACNRLIFCLFDQMQRQAASQSDAARVKNNKESLVHCATWVSDPDFFIDLKIAVKNPECKKSKQIPKKS